MKRAIWKKESIFVKIVEVYKDFGIFNLITQAIDFFWRKILYLTYNLYYPILKLQKQTFVYNNKILNYNFQKYNLAWRNERKIEIPILIEELRSHKNKKLLEVGNVFSHYFQSKKYKRIIVDKYERETGVINIDVLDYYPKNKFDYIFSISTIEHIGIQDENDNDLASIKALKHLHDYCLKNGGEIIITVPFGYNYKLDKYIKSKKNIFSRELFFLREDSLNNWRQVSKKEILGIKYGKPYPYANAIFVGIIKRRHHNS